MMSSTLEELTLLLEKVDRILLLLETRAGPARQPVVGVDTGKEKPSPLSSDNITRHQERFEKLYGTWDAGEGLQVVDELVAMHADELRKFADANNLNGHFLFHEPLRLRSFHGETAAKFFRPAKSGTRSGFQVSREA